MKERKVGKNDVFGCLVDDGKKKKRKKKKKKRDFGGAHKFSLLPHQNTIFPNGREKWVKIFGQNCPHFFFFFGLN